MSAESWPEAIREAVEDFRRDVPKIMNDEFVCVPDPGDISVSRLLRSWRIKALNELVAEFCEMPVFKLTGRDRRRKYVRARRICWHILQTSATTSITISEIGRSYGFDHTTVLFGLTELEREMRNDPILQDDVNDLRREWEALGV